MAPQDIVALPSTALLLPAGLQWWVCSQCLLPKFYDTSIRSRSPEVLLCLDRLIQNDDKEQYSSSLEGPELTQLVDFIDEVLDVTPITDDVSRRCLHKLQAICGLHNILPSSHNISGEVSRVGDDPVASGGFSDVWKGIYDGRKVCIKYLRITQQTRQAIEKACILYREAVMWKRLRHPNIVPLIGVTRTPLQFVSEWMPNGTVTDYLCENPGANRIALLLDVAEGLAFLHGRSTAHGDLKGAAFHQSNILIDYNGRARLTDFGFTSVVRRFDSVLITKVQGYSPGWAAPEILAEGDGNTREADVFAFAMVTIEVFTGRRPFKTFTTEVTTFKIMEGERPDRPQDPGSTDEVWDVTLRCWDENPAQRPAMTSVVGTLREVKRQTIICEFIAQEQQYIKNLDFVEEVYIRRLRNADPPVIRGGVHEFINEVFGNILDLRECNRHFLEMINSRQREQGVIALRIGDIFLNAETEFRPAYTTYVCQLAVAEKRSQEEMENNGDFRFRAFLEQSLWHPDNANKKDLKHWLNRPLEHLRMYLVFFEEIRLVTAEGDPDIDSLNGAIETVINLLSVPQLKAFQQAMGKGPTGKYEWRGFVPEGVRSGIPKQVAKRQAVIFQLIQGEMAYVNDLENLEYMYVRPLRSMDPPIIPRDRLESFIRDVFHNFGELHAHHRRLLDQLFEIQREEHPIIRSITAPMYDAVLTFRDAYLEYVPNYPIAAYRIDDEMANNPQFKAFVDRCVRHVDARKLDMKSFIVRPVYCLLRYELLLRGLLEETSAGHGDLESIPALLDVIKGLGKEIEPRVVSAKQKQKLWEYNAKLDFKAGEHIDMDLLHENRRLFHTCTLMRQPETGFDWGGWVELFVLLFDNFLVMTKPKEKDGITKHQVYRRASQFSFQPIPLDLLTLATFTDPPTRRGGGLLPFGGSNRREVDGQAQNASSPAAGTSPEAVNDGRAVFPCTIHHNGRLGGLYTLFAETSQARLEWKAKLEEAIELRKVVQELNKVFEVETLSVDTFYASTLLANAGPSWNNDGNFTGKVTCSVPFSTPDGRALVAIGCAEGVWIGFRHDSRSMRQVVHLRMVTQCAMLEDFGIFIVLADKSLFAYYIEALVPSSYEAGNASQTPQELSGNKDVQFFTVGMINGRTLIIYMKKKNHDSVFRVLEPVITKIYPKSKPQPSIGSRFGLRSQRSEWFRVYPDFFLPSDSYDLLFLKARIVILCSKGFEIMDLSDFKSVTIPQREDPRLEMLAKRAESCRPIGMFGFSDEELLLCYDEFGLYVSRFGEISRTGTVEWEGKAERVAWHPPYILLFDPQFIEIRHVETGRLVQIISGNDMRCSWDGRGTYRAIPEGALAEVVSQEPRVHGVMNMEMPQLGNMGETVQHVFGLMPTAPLSFRSSG
ncbi:CNH domain-containing protein [Thelephora terrestris]|uniref:CNH domain-containing protein n=1 Tax=Thelephora terrestris TaxID=56493 RepID=A0A9P6HF95_9AGAM|nr:CNH domain-containing protein [Thelephora terrestris]